MIHCVDSCMHVDTPQIFTYYLIDLLVFWKIIHADLKIKSKLYPLYFQVELQIQSMKFSNTDEVAAYAHRQNKILVIHGDQVLDVTTFAKHHPGGAGLLFNYKNKDITDQLKTHHELTYRLADSLTIGSFQKQIRKIIVPQKALMGQICKLNHQEYLTLINSPHWMFVDSPPMFDNFFCEFWSHNKWYSVLTIMLLYTMYYWNRVDFSLIQFNYGAISLILGIISFSLLQYVLHRFLFHSEAYLPNSVLFRQMHFTFHGVHHILPLDPDRLVFPPPLSIIFATIGQYAVLPFVTVGSVHYQYLAIYGIGIIYGYLIYDMTHYALHHMNKSTGYFGNLQRYHNQHHFSGQDAGFGVSSKFWDIIFGTLLKKTQPIK